MSQLPPPVQSSVLIVGLARNSGKKIRNDLNRIIKAANEFKKLCVYIVESDSDDETVKVLEKISKLDRRIRYTSMGELRKKFPKRTDRIAQCRNRYLDEIRTNPEYSTVDYIIVADLDGINNLIDAHSLTSCWKAHTPWDMCAANRSSYYYDVWALRHDDWCPEDCWAKFNRLRSQIGNENAFQMAILSAMIKIDSKLPLIPVSSAFGGLAIYRRQALIAGNYIGLTESNEEICEHISLHEQIRKAGYSLYINPAMIAGSNDEHIQEKYIWMKWRRWAIEIKKKWHPK
jgi:hypothetical protein